MGYWQQLEVPVGFLKLFKCSGASLIRPWWRFPPSPSRLCVPAAVIPGFASVLCLVLRRTRSTSCHKSIYFEPNVNTGLRGSGGQRRQKHRDGASIHYIMRVVTLYRVCLVKSGTVEKAILVPSAQTQQTFWHFVFLSYFPPATHPATLRFQTPPATWERGRCSSRRCVCWPWALRTPPGQRWRFRLSWGGVELLRLNLLLREEERWWWEFIS